MALEELQKGPKIRTPPSYFGEYQAPKKQSSLQLDRGRWVQLSILSSLSLLSDWVCFAVSPILHLVEDGDYPEPSLLVATFLAANVLSTLVEPLVVDTWGLRSSVILGGSNSLLIGSVLTLVGCFTRALSIVWLVSSSGQYLMYVGTAVAGAAQPYFSCTPSILASAWVGRNERTLAATVAYNSNNAGIAVSFIVGGAFLRSSADLEKYFWVLTAISAALLIITISFFRNEPKLPPSANAALLRCKRKPGYLIRTYRTQIVKVWQQDGYLQTAVAFSAACAVSNTLSAFVESLLQPLDVSQTVASATGAIFQIAFIMGSSVIATLVDRTGWFHSTALICLALSCFFHLCFMGALDSGLKIWTIVTLILMGFFIGPVEPLSAEIGVETTFPSNKSITVASQQLLSNFFSAILVPIMNMLRDARTSYSKSLLALLIFLVISLVFFSTFRSPYNRLLQDKEWHSETGSWESTTLDVSSQSPDSSMVTYTDGIGEYQRYQLSA